MKLNQLIEVLTVISQNHPDVGEMPVGAEGHSFAGHTHFQSVSKVCGARVEPNEGFILLCTHPRRSR